MIPFATEFPIIQTANRASFVAEVISWLRGSEYSKVLLSNSEKDLDGENVFIHTAAGEQLRLREVNNDAQCLAIGFRHDIPDDAGRLWRTEAVLKFSNNESLNNIVRLRTQCIVRKSGADIVTPIKPYIIKSILKEGWGGIDKKSTVSDQPVWLEESDVEVAQSIVSGMFSDYLPVLYISAVEKGRWFLSPRHIEKLAYDLGGVVHVVVEPSRDFSFKLRDATAGENAYGGAIAIAVPKKGFMKRFNFGANSHNKFRVINVLKEAAVEFRSQMPVTSWDWTELQEQALRLQRQKDKNRISAGESEKLYIEEIENLQDRILQLEEEINSHAVDKIEKERKSTSVYDSFANMESEIYPGELADRTRFAAQIALSVADKDGIDQRSKFVFQWLVDNTVPSPALNELIQDISRATKDPKRTANELTSLLSRHGYKEKFDNKHVKLEARRGYGGLETITLAKTPSEHRGLNNARKQIERALGIRVLLGK